MNGALALALATALGSHAGAAEAPLHRGTVQGDNVQWHSTWRSRSRCVELAAPFDAPAPYTVEMQDHAPHLCRPADHGWSLTYERPFPSEALDLPLLADTLQRVEVKGARFESRDGTITKHLKQWSSTGVSRRDRKALDRALPRSTASTQIYLRPAGGQPPSGALRPPGASTGVVYGALGVFVALGVLMALVHRLLEHGARKERVNRWLDEEGMLSDDL